MINFRSEIFAHFYGIEQIAKQAQQEIKDGSDRHRWHDLAVLIKAKAEVIMRNTEAKHRDGVA